MLKTAWLVQNGGTQPAFQLRAPHSLRGKHRGRGAGLYTTVIDATGGVLSH